MSTAGALSLGTMDNIRWEVTNADYAKGTFTLVIRRGDDSQSNKNILETFKRGEDWRFTNERSGNTHLYACRYPVGAGVRLRSVEVFEHDANSAVYEG
jgi:hypothetical protein